MEIPIDASTFFARVQELSVLEAVVPASEVPEASETVVPDEDEKTEKDSLPSDYDNELHEGPYGAPCTCPPCRVKAAKAASASTDAEMETETWEETRVKFEEGCTTHARALGLELKEPMEGGASGSAGQPRGGAQSP